MDDIVNEDIKRVIEGLCQSQKLLRDRALAKLSTDLLNLSEPAVHTLINCLLQNLENRDSSWEAKHGSLEGLCILITKNTHSFFEEQQLHESDTFSKIRHSTIHLLTDPELRVRQAAGNVLGAMCKKDGGATYRHCKDLVFQLVKLNLERQPDDPDSAVESEITSKSSADVSIDQLKQKLATSAARERRYSGSSDAQQIFHDTAGWKNLETSLHALKQMIEGTGEHFLEHCDQNLMDLLMETLTHSNRFVRETGFAVCGSLVSCGFMTELSASNNAHVDVLVKHLAVGLADNWSQVRLAASTAARSFLTGLPDAVKASYFPVLLPRICLNRYYVAEGVRLYSQETWRQVTGTEGKALVEKYMSEVVAYYIEATEADNHAVREAACACIAELATKLPTESVQPHVNLLLPALFRCFLDESWPVRDAACVSCGHFIQSFPEECRPHMDNLYGLFFNNLQDSIPSVRQGAAIALGNVVQAYGEEALSRICPVMKERLQNVRTQSNEVEKYSDLDTTTPATYGVAKKRKDNDPEAHENQVMYSCGSLAPKMGRGGGCSDCRFKRDPQPWEGGDGVIWLLGDVAVVGGAVGHQAVVCHLELVAEVCSIKHYTQHIALLETLCKNLPKFCKGLGKRLFKPHLHLFLDHIFYGLECESSLTSSAASQCLTALTAELGPNIMRGRIEQHNPNFLRAFDGNNYSAPF